MAEFINLTAEDGHVFEAYRTYASGDVLGRVVVLQEVFGVNKHIQTVCQEFSADGFEVIAPALFDRIEREVDLDYDADCIARGLELRETVGWGGPMQDVAAAVAALSEGGKVGIVGYSWGGTAAWLAATKMPELACAICYYGEQILKFKDEEPKCPVLIHVGELDELIPMVDIEAIQHVHTDVQVYFYPAGHGFNREQEAPMHEKSANLARVHTLNFIEEHTQ